MVGSTIVKHESSRYLLFFFFLKELLQKRQDSRDIICELVHVTSNSPSTVDLVPY